MEDYATYRGMALDDALDYLQAFDCQKALADAWFRLSPAMPEDVDRYYRSQDAYVEDLVCFNCRMETWIDNLPLLGVHGYVADFGGGVGILAIALEKLGCQVAYVDLPSPQRWFAEWRFARHGCSISVHRSLSELCGLDAIVSSDTIEHLHPDTLADTARQMWAALKPGGEVKTVSKFGKSDIWPMHYDTEQAFVDAMVAAGFEGGPENWRRKCH